MHDQASHPPLLYSVLGIPLDSLPLFSLAGDDITAASCNFLLRSHPILDEPANQKPSLLVTPQCMHPKSRTNIPIFILLLASIGETSTAHSSSHASIMLPGHALQPGYPGHNLVHAFGLQA